MIPRFATFISDNAAPITGAITSILTLIPVPVLLTIPKTITPVIGSIGLNIMNMIISYNIGVHAWDNDRVGLSWNMFEYAREGFRDGSMIWPTTQQNIFSKSLSIKCAKIMALIGAFGYVGVSVMACFVEFLVPNKDCELLQKYVKWYVPIVCLAAAVGAVGGYMGGRMITSKLLWG